MIEYQKSFSGTIDNTNIYEEFAPIAGVYTRYRFPAQSKLLLNAICTMLSEVHFPYRVNKNDYILEIFGKKIQVAYFYNYDKSTSTSYAEHLCVSPIGVHGSSDQTTHRPAHSFSIKLWHTTGSQPTSYAFSVLVRASKTMVEINVTTYSNQTTFNMILFAAQCTNLATNEDSVAIATRSAWSWTNNSYVNTAVYPWRGFYTNGSTQQYPSYMFLYDNNESICTRGIFLPSAYEDYIRYELGDTLIQLMPLIEAYRRCVFDKDNLYYNTPTRLPINYIYTLGGLDYCSRASNLLYGGANCEDTGEPSGVEYTNEFVEIALGDKYPMYVNGSTFYYNETYTGYRSYVVPITRGKRYKLVEGQTPTNQLRLTITRDDPRERISGITNTSFSLGSVYPVNLSTHAANYTYEFCNTNYDFMTIYFTSNNEVAAFKLYEAEI